MAEVLEAAPFDIWHQVASYLEPQDYMNLGTAVPFLQGALRDEPTAKKVVRVRISVFLHQLQTDPMRLVTDHVYKGGRTRKKRRRNRIPGG